MKKLLQRAAVLFLIIPPVSFVENANFHPIHELNDSQFSFGTYETEGYVVGTYDCVACQKTKECVGCNHDHIVISEENLLLEKYFLSDKELIIFVEDIKQFEKGTKYRFLVQVLDVKTTEQRSNNLKLVYFEKKRGE